MPKTFAERVHTIVRQIPRGQVLTYGEVAKRVGSPRAARAVGSLLHKNKDPQIPCHRVVRADWQTGGYNRGTARKIQLLKKEGVQIEGGKVV